MFNYFEYIAYYIIGAIVVAFIIYALLGRRKDKKTGFKPSAEEEARTRQRAERDAAYAAHYGGPGHAGVVNPPKDAPYSPHYPEEKQ